MITFLQKTISSKPWLWIVALFIGLIILWSWFITLAVKNQPETIVVPPRETSPAAPSTEAHDRD